MAGRLDGERRLGHGQRTYPFDLQTQRDVGVVLSGGGVNGVLMELGFLKRLRASALWPRVAAIFGTSSGALAGTLAALDRVDDLERFLLALRPEQAFRPHRLWRLPFLGLYDYALPRTVAVRLGDPEILAARLAGAAIEVIVVATDVTDDHAVDGGYELVYSSRSTGAEVMAQAVLASAAVSALVLPLPVGDRIATDGAWVRNFPLGHAYRDSGVELIVSLRYVPTYARLGVEWLARFRRRLERFPRIPPVRALIAELREAEERAERGEPGHWGDMFARLMRVAVQQNTANEERVARDIDAALAELRADVGEIVRRDGGRRGRRVADSVDERFAAASVPFLGDRLIPRIAIQATAGDVTLETGLRRPRPWPRRRSGP
ncbi:MAG: patatin-like phospholipase family protein [Gaiellaceae bacterium]